MLMKTQISFYETKPVRGATKNKILKTARIFCLLFTLS